MAKQIRGFWKRLCAIFATILGVGVVDKDANAATPVTITLLPSEIKSVANCEYDVFRCEDGSQEGLNAYCQYHAYQATGETARLLAAYAQERSCNGSGGYLYRNAGSFGVTGRTTVTWNGIPRFCYDLWTIQNIKTLLRSKGYNYVPYVSRTCDETVLLTSGAGVNYNGCEDNEFMPGLDRISNDGRYYDKDVIGSASGPYSVIKWYAGCTTALARMVGCADTSHVYARNGVPMYTDNFARYFELEDVENGTLSCIDLGCGNFAGDTSVQNGYSLNQNACFVNVADYIDEYGDGAYYDESGTFEYVAYDADDNECNCFSNGNVVCS